MLKLIAGRLVQNVLVLLILSWLTFALLAAAGGDALAALRNDPLVSAETINELSRIYGLDQPLLVRYMRWLASLAQGEMGHSFFYHAPVWIILWPRLLATLSLAAVAMTIASVAALTLGALAAWRAGTWVDRVCEIVILLAAGTPRIVLALIALMVAARTSVSPVEGTASSNKGFAHILLPALVLCVPLAAVFLAQARDGLSEALGQEFVRAARAKGLSERVVILRHALRHALAPLVTVFGYSVGGALNGSVIVETVLGWPGIGQLSVTAVRSRDVPVVMSIVLVTGGAVLAGNLIADLLLRANDPRLRQDKIKLHNFRRPTH